MSGFWIVQDGHFVDLIKPVSAGAAQTSTRFNMAMWNHASHRPSLRCVGRPNRRRHSQGLRRVHWRLGRGNPVPLFPAERWLGAIRHIRKRSGGHHFRIYAEFGRRGCGPGDRTRCCGNTGCCQRNLCRVRRRSREPGHDSTASGRLRNLVQRKDFVRSVGDSPAVRRVCESVMAKPEKEQT